MTAGLIIVTNTCFGHVGPMAQYGGFEGIAVTVTGVTTSEVAAGGSGLGMYANDYMTGYLMAVGAMLALAARAQRGGSYHVHASLCQSAMWLQRHGLRADRHIPGSIVPLDHFDGHRDGLADVSTSKSVDACDSRKFPERLLVVADRQGGG